MRKLAHSQTGLSIVEALVTMVILMITLGGVYQIFQSNSLTYRMQEGLARVQENGRFAMDFLVNDIRMAGHRGCSSFGPLTNTLNDAEEWTYNFDVGIFGYDDVSASFTDLGSLNIEQNTDVIIIRSVLGNGVNIVKNNSSAQLFVAVVSQESDACDDDTDRVSGICDGDILLVSDCKKSRVFQATNIQIAGGNELNISHSSDSNPPPGNNATSWGGANALEEERFGTDAEIFKISTIVYYLRKRDSSSDNPPSLYRKHGTASAQELVEGVENIQFLYGLDTSGDRNVDTYVNATSVSDWDNVRSVKIGLLVSTMDEIRGMDTNTDSYNVLVTSIGPANDMRIRRVFTATVGLRNRLK
jgi:type IV pilus assembly protein PilW